MCLCLVHVEMEMVSPTNSVATALTYITLVCLEKTTKICHFTLQGLVLIITIMREAIEEIRCYLRDKEVNSQIYSKLSTRGNN